MDADVACLERHFMESLTGISDLEVLRVLVCDILRGSQHAAVLDNAKVIVDMVCLVGHSSLHRLDVFVNETVDDVDGR